MLSTANPKPLPRAIAKAKRRADDEKQLADAYAEVDRRDQGVCVVTGAFTVPGAVDPRHRREHHHLAGRRVRPDWKYDPRRIVTVRADVHRLLTIRALELEGDDANKRIVAHWNREVVARGDEPFRLKSKRWSQNEAGI